MRAAAASLMTNLSLPFVKSVSKIEDLLEGEEAQALVTESQEERGVEQIFQELNLKVEKAKVEGKVVKKEKATLRALNDSKN